MTSPLSLKVLADDFAIAQLPANAPLPDWFVPGALASASWAEEELSIVCPGAQVPPEVRCERGWRCLQLQGPFPFHLTGVLLSVLQPLAAADIGIFALSTFDTDYVLVKADALDRAIAALQSQGHSVAGGDERCAARTT